MRLRLRITSHAIERYCLRIYRDVRYYLAHPEVVEEIREKVDHAKKSKYNPKSFFKKPGNMELLEDSSLIYAIREGEVITVIPLPGANPIYDMLRNAIKRRYD